MRSRTSVMDCDGILSLTTAICWSIDEVVLRCDADASNVWCIVHMLSWLQCYSLASCTSSSHSILSADGRRSHGVNQFPPLLSVPCCLECSAPPTCRTVPDVVRPSPCWSTTRTVTSNPSFQDVCTEVPCTYDMAEILEFAFTNCRPICAFSETWFFSRLRARQKEYSLFKFTAWEIEFRCE